MFSGFNELRVADVRLGSTFLACVRVCLCLARSVRVCVRAQGNVCLRICVCALVCVSNVNAVIYTRLRVLLCESVPRLHCQGRVQLLTRVGAQNRNKLLVHSLV